MALSLLHANLMVAKTDMRFYLHTLSILTCALLISCTHQDKNSVTPQFLLDRGFSQSTTDPTLYELKSVTVGEAGRRLGFNTKDLMHGTNNPPNQDIRGVVVRDYEFAVVSDRQTNIGNIGLAQNALDRTDTLCTVEAHLIPQLRRAPAK
jgi:hypothetical protein